MKIRIGEYQLSSDANQFIVSETKIKETGENIGEEYQTNETYHPQIIGALNNVLKRRLLKSDATTLIQLRIEIEENMSELRKYFKETI